MRQKIVVPRIVKIWERFANLVKSVIKALALAAQD